MTRPFTLSPARLRTTVLAAVGFLVLSAAPVRAQSDFRSVHGADSAAYQKWINTAKADGFRAIYVNGYDAGDSALFAAVAVKDGTSPPWQARHDLTADQYQKLFDTLPDQGYRPLSVSGYLSGKTPRFAATWVKDGADTRWAARHNLSAADYQAAVDAMTKDGLRPAVVSVYGDGSGSHLFAALFVDAGKTPWVARHDLTAAGYQQQFDTWGPKGYRPVSVSVYRTDAGLRFALVMVKDGQEGVARHGLTSNQYQDEFNKQNDKGFHPVSVCGYLDGDTLRYAAAWVKETNALPANELPTTGVADPNLVSFDRMMIDFVQKHHLAGAALAVAKDGRVVYARGFGYADLDKKEQVEPDALFRIASVTKPLTSAAVLQLVERGKLKLDDKVFDVLELKEPEGKGVKFDEHWKKVTILELLQHRGGWDRDKSFDPMFRSPTIVKVMKTEPPADPEAIIHYMLRQPLDFDPGERYAYSNFGYCVLGRVIEKVSGQGYEEYVKKEVLAPLKIHRMRVGKTLLEGRAEGEVKYYDSGEGPAIMGPKLGKQVPEPYGAWCLESMDAHGAWIASAEDLVRFASSLNDPAHCKILSEKSIETLFKRPPGAAGETKNGKPADVYYGCGWEVRQLGGGAINTWHSGSLPGTSTLLVRRNDGLTWAVLFNTREGVKGDEPAGAIDPLVHAAADAVKVWPKGK